MNLKVQEVCDGWILNQNTYLDITDKNGMQIRNEFRNSSTRGTTCTLKIQHQNCTETAVN